MHIRGIHHVAIKYEGPELLEKAVYFYRDLLGLSLVRQWGKGNETVVLLDAGNAKLELFANSSGLPHGMINHFAFCADDVDGFIEKVRNAGYEIILEPDNRLFPSEPPFAVRIGFCIGPGGEKVEFFTER